MKNNLYLTVVVLLLYGCSNGSGHKKVEQIAVADPVDRPLLVLETADFGGDADISKVKVECSMLEKLATSIIDSAEIYNARIELRTVAGQREDEEYSLVVTYTEVIPHRWVFMAMRPGSSATVKADVIKNGKLLKTTSKAISSGMAFGACDRLEKIAVAGGRYISKWVSNQTYE